ncbi:hypothetical protein ACOQFB_15665 [Anaeromyxobacter sp. Red801]|uniref:hypothetical protein n=1 Tax=Anaeromyxobacter sp. Red801 TaxID=3411632 RepID=UPI003BA30789
MRSPPAAASVPLVLAALLAQACAAPARTFRCPEHGGAPWRELTSDHFVLRTDLGAPEAAALVARLERLRAGVAATLGAPSLGTPAPEDEARVEVIAFRTDQEYRPFAPDGAEGYYLRYAGGPPRIVLSGAIDRRQRALLAHELTHHYLAGALRRQPRWFAEGLAVYMESLGDDPGVRALHVGAPPADRLARARASPVPVRELLAWDGGPGARPALDDYAASWLLVHWLAHRRPEAFGELERRLAEGEAPARAWTAALPDLDPAVPGALERLDRTLAEYARGPLEARRREAEVPVAVGYFERAVAPVEVHALRLALWQLGPRKGRAALEDEVREALVEDPAHPIALQYLAAMDKLDPARLARRSVAAHPEDPRAWTFLASALDGEEQAGAREAALRRAADLAPSNPAALHNLAQELLARGRSGEGLPFARRAAQIAPWSAPVLAGYAAVLSDLGRCGEAIPLQQRALDALPEREPADARRELLRGLDRYALQCQLARRLEPAAAARP